MDRKDKNREYMRQRRADAGFRAAEAARMRERRRTAEVRGRERIYKREYERRRFAEDEVYREKERKRKRRRKASMSPEAYARKRAKARRRQRERYQNDETYRSRVLAAQNARHAANPRRHKINRLHAAVLEGYGARCVCCGETETCFLEIDHVNGGGSKHFKGIGHAKVYEAIIASGFSAEYRVLCANCNHGRQRNGGICPHETLRAQDARQAG